MFKDQIHHIQVYPHISIVNLKAKRLLLQHIPENVKKFVKNSSGCMTKATNTYIIRTISFLLPVEKINITKINNY